MHEDNKENIQWLLHRSKIDARHSYDNFLIK